MATAEIMRIVALRTGIDYEHVQALGHNLIRSGAWNEDERQAVTYLLLALLAGAEPKSATSTARHYHNLQRVDDDGTVTTAGQMIEDMLAAFLEQARTPFSAYAYRTAIEVYTGTPAVRIRTACPDGSLELAYIENHDTDAWHQNSVRRSTILPGKGLFNIAADMLMKPTLRTTNVPFRVTDVR